MRNVSFWRRLSQVITTEDLDHLLNLRSLATRVRSGIRSRVAKVYHVDLATLTVPTGLGVPLTYGVTARTAGKVEMTVDPSNMGYRYNLDQIIRNMDLIGNLKIM